MGPTAAGKTELALQCVAEFPLEIISVDSAMIYRGMDIGTGKPPREVLQRVPHHLVDIRDPSEIYSAGQFVRDAQKSIADIQARGKIPLLVGGTMLYFRALTEGLADLPEANAEVRAQLNVEAADVGWAGMHAQLASVDPIAALRILPNDAQRIQRALEVYRLTGQTLSALHAVAVRQSPSHRYLRLVWSPSDRAILYDRIAQRFQQMMTVGLLDEVSALYRRKDLSPELSAMRSVGYRQLLGHLAGKYDLNEAVNQGITATRHLARRQLIWLRRMPDLIWHDSLELAAADLIKQRLNRTLA
ncbi:MAG: tRNA (adenosine(37)-N6)-dimethylallyltransferase MiaA [Candidatus Obscuribacterales bacterium]|nr:tRNA (adenosine(37)-N6)-dimethylallyltransferase MiaA [Steroidobacteraceae bacterium]